MDRKHFLYINILDSHSVPIVCTLERLLPCLLPKQDRAYGSFSLNCFPPSNLSPFPIRPYAHVVLCDIEKSLHSLVPHTQLRVDILQTHIWAHGTQNQRCAAHRLRKNRFPSVAEKCKQSREDRLGRVCRHTR